MGRDRPSPSLTHVYQPSDQTQLAAPLAAAFLSGDWTLGGLVRRAGECVEPAPRWVPGLAEEVLASYHRPPLDRPRELARFLTVQIARLREPPTDVRPRVRRRFLFEERMGRRRWSVPELDTPADLAAWLELGDGQLEWLADVRGLERRAADERLRNYRYRWIERPGGPPRVIERPKSRLKRCQRQILREILNLIPSHDAAHGFVGGRSAVSHAGLHTGSATVLRFDLEDFFASVAAARVFGMFRTAGYAEAVAHALTGLCTNTVPSDQWASLPRPSGAPGLRAHWRLGSRLATPHLPQGGPASPALANLAAFALDRRLDGLAVAAGARYSRYADDLAFSGDRSLAASAPRITKKVIEIAASEGFRLNPGKTRIMRGATRQSLCGVVINERTNVRRAEFDLLKAIVHNSVRNGPDGENRAGVSDFRAHLLGRIAWVEQLHPAHGAKLRAGFDEIRW